MAGKAGSGRRPIENVEAVKKRFADWLQMSKEQRSASGDGKTQAEFGEKYGFTREVLSRWKRDPGFKELSKQLTANILTSEDVTAMIIAQITKAKDGDTVAFNNLMNRAGIKIENPFELKEDELDEVKLGELSEEELEKLVSDFG